MPISLISPLSARCSLHPNPHHRRRALFPPPLSTASLFSLRLPPPFASRTFLERSNGVPSPPDTEEKWEFTGKSEAEAFDVDEGFASAELKHLGDLDLDLEVKELDEIPEKWRRSRLAWMCKQLPAHRAATRTRILNKHRKWLRQEDATYIAVHCLRIRENDSGFGVYKWMMQQAWYQFDFAFASKLAEYLGEERKFSKCREILDDIIDQGRVPNESTFHILIVAYLSSPIEGCLEEACNVYNRMIQLGGYRPPLSLHNSLFRAIVSKPGSTSKHYLKQAEFVFHNVLTSGFRIQNDIYAGLIWLHSYQDDIDKERMRSLRKAMRRARFKEGSDVLLSVLRACSKNGNVEEAERTWPKLLNKGGDIPPQACLYRMEVYAKAGEPMKSLEIFRKMQGLGSIPDVAYNKIIEILCKAQEMEHAESVMQEFIQSGKKFLLRSFIDLMNMYFNLSLHDKLELTFSQSLEKCRPDITIHNIYLHSLVRVGNLDKTYEIFNKMRYDEKIGINAQSCNNMLSGFLSSRNNSEAAKMYKFMCQKKYIIETPLMEKLDPILSSRTKRVKKSESPKVSKEQRETLVGLLLGGLQIEPSRRGKDHVIRFEFNEDSDSHPVLKAHVYNQFHELIRPSSKPLYGPNIIIPCTFYTISHKHFSFYADQFWQNGRPVIPKLIHRWLSPRALAYWYMYGGHRTPSGDIVLRLKGDCEGAKRVVKALRANFLRCRVKRRGSVFWIGFLGNDSSRFWKLIEPCVLNGISGEGEQGQGHHSCDYGLMENEEMRFEDGSDSDETASDYYSDCDDM